MMRVDAQLKEVHVAIAVGHASVSRADRQGDATLRTSEVKP
ncbi:hypothetical protein WJU23_11235 [Prosthecobacter sp. SYSU 5D2]